jgi:hypothetical protein
MHKKSLLMIDVTSALGQRVLKHTTAAVETKVAVVNDAEHFCRTPIKDQYQDRLRMREPTYPITWKLTHKRLRQQLHCHIYKFTNADKAEFMEKMRTGLIYECRQLLACLKKCSVVVKRLSRKTLYKWKPSLQKTSVPLRQLSAEEIRQWTEPKPKPPPPDQPCVFPEGPALLSRDTDVDRVLGLQRKDQRKPNPKLGPRLLASHCMSETESVQLQLQKLTVYRSLLTDLSTCSVTDRDELLDREKNYPNLLSILSNKPRWALVFLYPLFAYLHPSFSSTYTFKLFLSFYPVNYNMYLEINCMM